MCDKAVHRDRRVDQEYLESDVNVNDPHPGRKSLYQVQNF